jgi:hypothetical protein
MSELKEYFDRNRIVFDNEEPSEGHFERFENRLNRCDVEKRRRQALKIKLRYTISAAVSILLVLAAGIWILISSQQDIAPSISEFEETEAFYSELMNGQIDEILCRLDKADYTTRTLLENDLRNLTLDTNSFVEEIRGHQNEELAIYYLVEHYSANLQTLQLINAQLGEYFKC